MSPNSSLSFSEIAADHGVFLLLSGNRSEPHLDIGDEGSPVLRVDGEFFDVSEADSYLLHDENGIRELVPSMGYGPQV